MALVARPFVGAPMADMVVQLNMCLGFNSFPLCDEIFTVVNRNIVDNAGPRFGKAYKLAKKVRGRVDFFPVDPMDGIIPGLSKSLVQVRSHPSGSVNDLAVAVTTGIFAAMFYESCGAQVVLCGYSGDRKAVVGRIPLHEKSLAFEQEFISTRERFSPSV